MANSDLFCIWLEYNWMRHIVFEPKRVNNYSQYIWMGVFTFLYWMAAGSYMPNKNITKSTHFSTEQNVASILYVLKHL